MAAYKFNSRSSNLAFVLLAFLASFILAPKAQALDVSAYYANYDLLIYGTNAADNLTISQNGETITVVSNSTPINGAQSFSFVGPLDDIRVFLEDGPDLVKLENIEPFTNHANVEIYSEGGGCKVEVMGLRAFQGFRAESPRDRLKVSVQDSLFNQKMFIDAGEGNLLCSMIGAPAWNLEIKGGPDKDICEFYESNLNESFELKTYGGDDEVSIVGCNISGTAKLYSGSGEDFVEVSNSNASGRITLSTSDGDDEVRIAETTSSGSLHVISGSGDDLVGIDNSSFRIVVDVDSGSGDDDVSVTDTVLESGSIRVYLGPGDDIAKVLASFASRWLRINAGSGNDDVDLSLSYGEHMYVDGGWGWDALEAEWWQFTDIEGDRIEFRRYR